MSTNLTDALKQSTENEIHFRQYSDKIASYVADTRQQMYVEKKIMKRLAIFAEHNKDMNSPQLVPLKGENIFAIDEKDKKSAAAFLIILLECIEQWSQKFPFAEDFRSPSLFRKSYEVLKLKNVIFPSSVKSDPIVQDAIRSLNTGPSQNLQQNENKKQNPPLNPAQRQKYQQIADQLKKKMIEVNSVSTKSEKFLAKLERSGFQFEPHEMIEMDIQLQRGQKLCEQCIQTLTTEEITKVLAKSEELLDRMLKQQEQILTAISIIQPHSEEVKKTEAKEYERIQQQYSTNAQNKPQQSKNIIDQLNGLDFGFPNQRADEEVKGDGDDLWNNLEDFATSFQNQQQDQNQGKFPVFPQLDYDQNDPFAEAVQENLRKNQNENQAIEYNQQDDFYTGIAQSQNKNEEQADHSHDFRFDQQDNQVIRQQDKSQEQQEEIQKEDDEENDQVTGLKLWQLDINEIKVDKKQDNQPSQPNQPYYTEQQQISNNFQDYQVQQQQQPIYQNDNTQQLENEISELRRQNHILEQEVYNLQRQNQSKSSYGNDRQYEDLNQQYKYLQEQFEQQKTYYQNQIFDRDNLIRLKQDELDNSQDIIRNLQNKVKQLELELSSGTLQYQQQPLQHHSPELNYEQQTFQSNQQNFRSLNTSKEESKLDDFMTNLNQQKNSNSRVQENHQEGSNHQRNQSQIADNDQTNDPSSQQINYPHFKKRDDQQMTAIEKQIDNFYFRGLYSDKSILYEDLHVQIGFIRKISKEWVQANFKIYIGNKSETDEITSLQVSTEQPLVKISNQEEIEPLLKAKGQREVQILISGQLDNKPYFKLQYQQVFFLEITYLNRIGDKSSGDLKIRLPINPFFYCEPFNVPSDLFHSAWKYSKVKKGCFIDMNLKRSANLQQLKQIVTINEKYGKFVQGIDQKPNIVGFAFQHKEGQILIKIEVSATGKDCKIEMAMETNSELIDSFLDTIVELISQK